MDDLSNIQTITFSVLGIMLAIGSLVVGYLQLKRMGNQIIRRSIEADVEMRDVDRYVNKPLSDGGSKRAVGLLTL
jgi:hypothetical protein